MVFALARLILNFFERVVLVLLFGILAFDFLEVVILVVLVTGVLLLLALVVIHFLEGLVVLVFALLLLLGWVVALVLDLFELLLVAVGLDVRLQLAVLPATRLLVVPFRQLLLAAEFLEVFELFLVRVLFFALRLLHALILPMLLFADFPLSVVRLISLIRIQLIKLLLVLVTLAALRLLLFDRSITTLGFLSGSIVVVDGFNVV